MAMKEFRLEKVIGVANAKIATAAGAKFTPRGNQWFFLGDELPQALHAFSAEHNFGRKQSAPASGGRNIDGPQTLAEWRASRRGA